ncbi:hypothetical protein EYR40_004666 [Pleurotus pulmonarius]|nr:hypothetical protein EYR40_004666 [Pleurotus pulmonarius]
MDDTGETLNITGWEESLDEDEHYGTGAFGDIKVAELARLAYSEAQFYAIQFRQLRNDPSFLREQVEEEAWHRPELIPDAHGRAPTIRKLLSSPRFVAQVCRTVIHDLLNHWGIWSAIANDLAEIETLDERRGGAEGSTRRGTLMEHAKLIARQGMEDLETQVKQGLVFHTLDGGSWVRWRNYSDYSGAELERNPNRSHGFLTTFADQLLEGSLPRYVSPEVTWTRSKWTDGQRRALFQRLDEEPEHWETFDPYLAERLTRVQRLMDFTEMLNFPTSDQGERDGSFEMGLIIAADTLNSVNLEQHIQNITSLGSASSFNMVWGDIDAAFEVEQQGTPEVVVGFVQSPSRWYVLGEELQISPRPVTPPMSQSTVRIACDEPPAFVGIIRLQPRAAPQPEPEPRPTALPVFRVSRKVYDTFKKIFNKDEKGQLSFDELSYVSDLAFSQPVFIFILQFSISKIPQALTRIGFEFDGRRSGSRAAFKPPEPHKNIPYRVHLPHGSRSTLDRIRLNQCAEFFSETYGWTLEWFALKEQPAS